MCRDVFGGIGSALDGWVDDIDHLTLLNTYALAIALTVMFSGSHGGLYTFPLFLEHDIGLSVAPALVLNFFIAMYLLFPLGWAISTILRPIIIENRSSSHNWWCVDWAAGIVLIILVLPYAGPQLLTALVPELAISVHPVASAIATLTAAVIIVTGEVILFVPFELLEVTGIIDNLTPNNRAGIAAALGAGFWYVCLLFVRDCVVIGEEECPTKTASDNS